MIIYTTVEENPLLGEAYRKLASDDAREAQQEIAELLLGLDEPEYEDAEGEAIVHAIVLQINFQLLRGLTPDIHKSEAKPSPGITTTYRDRYLSSAAAAIVTRITGAATVAFTPLTLGT